MAFLFKDKEYSDKEVASAIKERKQARHDWCEQKAREFFATKERRKFYNTSYYVPEADDEGYFHFPDELINTIQTAIDKDFAENGPSPNMKAAIADVRQEIIEGMDLSEYEEKFLHLVCPGFEYLTINDIDLDDFIYCYGVRVLRFDSHDGKQTGEEFEMVRLSDDEYIQVLTELLYAPHTLSLDGLCEVLPEIGKKIAEHCTVPTETSAIFLDEMNDDIDNILEQIGGKDKIPHAGLFDNILVDIIEHNERKSNEN